MCYRDLLSKFISLCSEDLVTMESQQNFVLHMLEEMILAAGHLVIF